jgi:HB1, ASXL, restriction endonuclease HTH domain
MSKKKSTTKREASRPSIISMMKSKAGKGSKANPQNKAQATEVPPTEDTQATAATEQPTIATEAPLDSAGSDATQVTPPTAEMPPDDTTKKKGKAKKVPKPKKVSCLDAAANVLTDAGTAMTTGEMIEAMGKAKLWSSPNGQTPAATLYSAVLREINTKGKDSRFTKTERGRFAAK